jgi:hypothetical protein
MEKEPTKRKPNISNLSIFNFLPPKSLSKRMMWSINFF